MDFFRDAEDWLGGYPFEFATDKVISDHYEKSGFKLINLKKTYREGCNEFLFQK